MIFFMVLTPQVVTVNGVYKYKHMQAKRITSARQQWAKRKHPNERSFNKRENLDFDRRRKTLPLQ
jgi:hypothetical protein